MIIVDLNMVMIDGVKLVNQLKGLEEEGKFDLISTKIYATSTIDED